MVISLRSEGIHDIAHIVSLFFKEEDLPIVNDFLVEHSELILDIRFKAIKIGKNDYQMMIDFSLSLNLLEIEDANIKISPRNKPSN